MEIKDTMVRLPKFTAAAVQAAPIFLDRKATLEKACHLIKEAGRNGAALAVFPEAYVPTFPYWPRALPHPDRELSLDVYAQLYEQAVEVPSPEVDQLCAAAKKSWDLCHYGHDGTRDRGIGDHVQYPALY